MNNSLKESCSCISCTFSSDGQLEKVQDMHQILILIQDASFLSDAAGVGETCTRLFQCTGNAIHGSVAACFKETQWLHYELFLFQLLYQL